jgi:predicted dehydrogenase
MAGQETVRVGLVGAGAIFRSRHIPGLKKIAGVEVVCVANRSRESGAKIAGEFGIPEVMGDWQEVVARKDLDAVFIGTWPYKHREMSIAALLAGKHVFCQARMAMDVGEAHDMVAVSRARPGQVAMICPPPTRMPFEPFIQKLLAEGGLGRVVSVEMVHVSGANTKMNQVHWREQREYSGNQVMAMGIYAETLNAWVGPYESLSAQTGVFVEEKTDAAGKKVAIQVPQVVSISGRLKSGALCTEHHLGLAVDTGSVGDRLTIWGTAGTLRYQFGQTLEMARPGEGFTAVEVPSGLKKEWWAEDDFIGAVKLARAGQGFKVSPDFEEGLVYMQKVEAVHLSARTGRAVKPAEL